MNRTFSVLSPVAAVVAAWALAGCVAPTMPGDFPTLAAELPADGSIECLVAESGRFAAVEYHTAYDRFPAGVRAHIDQALPEGAEIHEATLIFADGKTFYEVAYRENGLAVEWQFDATGELIAREEEIALADLSAELRATVQENVEGIELTKAEQIKNGKGTLIEYHLKGAADGRRYKVRIKPAGGAVTVLVEVPGEIEIPLRP